MGKWADYCIVGVRFAPDRNRIETVRMLPDTGSLLVTGLIMPRRHMACFAELNDAEAADLARVLRRTLAKLYHGLLDPDFNYSIRTAPMEYTGVKYYHWYLSIIPRLTKMAGFELGSGMFINVSLPEENASFLRGIAVE